ncbi:hypothetical protein [Paraburkholderia ribeironis]|uniref:hypothetical protein n=1 Tax=Paraburkholderia ribeironis TaxID=1247936 RepID=UPI00139666D1|nr:hypothetical protein [Paraburkholderia ribeironis]
MDSFHDREACPPEAPELGNCALTHARSLDDLIGFERDRLTVLWLPSVSCWHARWELEDSSLGKGVFEACSVALARSESGVSQGTVLVYSPLWRVSRLSNSTLRSSGISARCGKG